MSTDTINSTVEGIAIPTATITDGSDINNHVNSSNVPPMTTTKTTTTTTTFDKYVSLTHKALQKSRSSLDTKGLIEMAYGEDALAVYGGSDMLVGILDDVLDKIINETIPQDFVNNYCCRHHRQQHGNDNKDGHNGSNSTNDDVSTETKNSSGLLIAGMTPQQRLDYIDQTIQHVIEWEERRAQSEALDVASAKASLEQTLLVPSSSTSTTTTHGGSRGNNDNDAMGNSSSSSSRASSQQLQTEEVIRYREHQQRLVVKRKLLEELQRVEDEIVSLQQRQVSQNTNIQAQLDVVQTVETDLVASANLLVTAPW